MVDLTSSDYKKIFGWFERTFGITTEPDEIPLEDKRVFWKLTFLAEDRMKEEVDDEEHSWLWKQK